MREECTLAIFYFLSMATIFSATYAYYLKLNSTQRILHCALYLPRAANALEEVGHPHRKNHRFSQQLFGVFQVSDVVPKAEPEKSASRTKDRTAAVAN